MSDNTTTLIGNVTRDPEIKVTTGGAVKATIGLAVNRRWQNRQSQEWEEQVSFFNVICWRDLADNVASTITKGMRIIVNGRLEQRSWETDDGSKRSIVEVTADDIGPSLKWATASVVRNPREGGPTIPRPSAAEVPAESADAFGSEPF